MGTQTVARRDKDSVRLAPRRPVAIVPAAAKGAGEASIWDVYQAGCLCVCLLLPPRQHVKDNAKMECN